jgi:SPP1 gp7 family putative phage head morphogenesis protein
MDYRKLQEQFSQYIYDESEKQEKAAYQNQKKNQDELLNLVGQILVFYTIADSKLSLGVREIKALEGDLYSKIIEIVKKEFDLEKNLINDILTNTTEEKYYSDAYVTQLAYDFKLQKLTNKQIKDIVNAKVDSELWSDRLWSNKKDLEKKLKTEITKFLQGTIDVNKIGKVIQDRYGQNAFNTKRLVQTEVSKCQSISNDVFAKEHGVEWQLYSATLDNKTSGLCRDLDGTRYRIDDADKRIPGENTHPFCRSVLINLPSSDWTPKNRKDNITNETINYKTYKEWKENNNI